MTKSPTIADNVDTLRTALSALYSTGHRGFEGLVEASFSRITGIPFRLSAGGSQFGVDGKSAYGDPRISFECKLYRQDLDIATVNAKLGELAIDDRGIDLWALCATTQVSAQIADNVRRFGEQFAISTVVLDWSKNGLPPLAAMLAMASHTVENFLSTHANKQPDIRAVRTALKVISNDKEFASQAERIRQILTAPATGLEAARLASAKWLGEALSNRQTARLRLEQPLSPGDSTEGTAQDRHYLVDKIAGFLSGPSTSKVLYIIGDEGTGKSWSVAQSWLRDSRKPMMLFISPSAFAETVAENDIQGLLVASIIRQTEGDQGTSHKGKMDQGPISIEANGGRSHSFRSICRWSESTAEKGVGAYAGQACRRVASLRWPVDRHFQNVVFPESHRERPCASPRGSRSSGVDATGT